MSRAVAIASVVYGVSILLSRLVGLLREAVIGRTLGNGPQADVYWSAFILPDFLNYLLAGGVLSIVFIPLFQAHLARGDEAAGWRSFSAIANPLVALAVVATVALFVAAPSLAPVMAPGMTAEQHTLLVHLVRIMLPAQIFHLVGGLISATLQARDQHTLPALAPLVYTGSIVVCGVALGSTLGAEGFAWGVLVGSMLGPFGLPLLGARRAGLRWSVRPLFDLRHADLRRYFKLALPVMLGFSVVVFDDLVIKRLASAVDDGVISRLQYARTLMKVPMGVFGLAAGMAAYPTLARLFAQGKGVEAWRSLVGALRMMLLLALGAQTALSVCGAEVAAVVWGTARFTAAELQEIGDFTAWLGLGLWAWSAQSLVARGYYAQQNTWLPTVAGSGVMLVLYPVYGWLAAHHGGSGLTWASSAAISLYVLILAVVLRRRLVGRSDTGPGLLDAVLRLLPAVVLGVVVGRTLSPLLATWPPLLRGATTGALAIFVYALTVRVGGLPEAQVLQTRLAGKLHRIVSRLIRRARRPSR